jgi:hypothetical protein
VAGPGAIAHTLAYDAAALGDEHPPTARLAKLSQPILVLTSGSDDFFEQAADATAAAIPHAARQVLEGLTHVADPKVIAPVLERFYTE